MKKTIFSLLFMTVALGAFAQMQVWSNGTIIFSHDANKVDSISFAGSPMRVQAAVNEAAATSLAGSVYTTSLAGSGTENHLYGLFFLDDNKGYYGYNENGAATAYNRLKEFTYTVENNTDIMLKMDNRTINGKIIGTNGLVFTNFLNNGYDSPTVFITINR